MRIVRELGDGRIKLKCSYCGTVTTDKRKNLSYLSTASKQRWPQISGSLGCVVNSRDHENAVAKAQGMVPTDHRHTNPGYGKRKAKS